MALLFGDGDADAHSATGFDAFYETVDFYAAFVSDVGSETGADPERVGGFDEHAVGTDVARAGTK